MNADSARMTPTPNIALEKVPLKLDLHTVDKAIHLYLHYHKGLANDD